MWCEKDGSADGTTEMEVDSQEIYWFCLNFVDLVGRNSMSNKWIFDSWADDRFVGSNGVFVIETGEFDHVGKRGCFVCGDGNLCVELSR